MEQLNIPDTNTVLYPGSIVILAEYPYSKWIVKYGWYTYKDQQLNGWYFRSITDGTVLSLSNVNLAAITLVSQGERPAQPCPPPPPMPGPAPTPGPRPTPGYGFTPREADQLRRSFITVDSIRQRDALDDGNLPDGRICRVNNVNGRPKYYAYDVSTSTWIEQPIDFMTETVADEKYVSKEEFDWELMSDPQS
jgi:hypothetical protein